MRLPPRSFPAQLCAPGGPSWSPCTQICRDPSQTGQNHDPMVHIAFWRKPSCAPTLVRNSREVLLGVANLWKTKAAVFEGVGGTSLSKVHITGPKLGCIQLVSWNAHLSSGLCSGKPLSVGIWSLWFSGLEQFQFCHSDTSRQIYQRSYLKNNSRKAVLAIFPFVHLASAYWACLGTE